MYKKIFAPLPILALVSFLLAGSSFWVLSSHKTQTVQTKTITITTTPVPTSIQPSQTAREEQFKAQPATPMAPTSTPTQSATTTVQTQQTTTTTNVSQSGPFVALSIHINTNLSTWGITLSGNQTPCSILQVAKDQGKLTSLTINHYGAPLNSDYVKEINGHTDGWTFTLNGENKSLGCSNYTLNSGDTVVWSYQ